MFMVIKMLWIKIKQGRGKIMGHNIINQCEDLDFCTYADGKRTEGIEERKTHLTIPSIVLQTELKYGRADRTI